MKTKVTLLIVLGSLVTAVAHAADQEFIAKFWGDFVVRKGMVPPDRPITLASGFGENNGAGDIFGSDCVLAERTKEAIKRPEYRVYIYPGAVPNNVEIMVVGIALKERTFVRKPKLNPDVNPDGQLNEYYCKQGFVSSISSGGSMWVTELYSTPAGFGSIGLPIGLVFSTSEFDDFSVRLDQVRKVLVKAGRKEGAGWAFTDPRIPPYRRQPFASDLSDVTPFQLFVDGFLSDPDEAFVGLAPEVLGVTPYSDLPVLD